MRLDRRLLVTAGLGILVLLALAGAGQSATAGHATAQDFVAQARLKVHQYSLRIASWPGPTQPVHAVSGKSIGVVTCGPAEDCTEMGNGVKEAAQALGWKATVYSPAQGTPDEVNAAMSRFLDAHVDAILWIGFPRVILGPTLARAKEQGVLMVSARTLDKTPNEVSIDERLGGEMVGYAVVADSGGKAQVVMITDNQFSALKSVAQGFASVLKRCAGCKILQSRDVTLPRLNTVEGEAANLIRRNPTATYLYAAFDLQAYKALEGVASAGALGRVKVVGGTGGQTPSIKLISNPASGFAFTSSVAEEWVGWATVDQTLRLFAGAPRVQHPVPIKLITSQTARLGRFTGDVHFRSRYRKLWGLTK